MFVEDLKQNDQMYDHVYLSPHLDDAALSCGGAIAMQRAAGERVLIVTLCTAVPLPDTVFSPLAQEFHADWGLPADQVVATRLEEDRRAMAVLDVDYHWANLLDAIYRRPDVYNQREALFSPAVPADDPLLAQLELFLRQLRGHMPRAIIYAPLAIGSHVDHTITYQAVRNVLFQSMAFYEDTPYVLQPGALDQRLAAIDTMLQPQVVPITAGLPAKVAAIAAYASQMGELFGGEAAMEHAIGVYGQRVAGAAYAYGERLWVPIV